MKGLFFQKPLEFQLRVEGETWTQGSPVKGVLEVKNHGQEPASLAEARVALAYGGLKKVHEKVPGALKVLAAHPSDTQTLEGGKSASFEWSFPTDRNCPITDSSNSLFLIYGSADVYEKMGQLQLAFKPDSIVQEFIKTLSIQFRFVQKTQKSSKGHVETKLSPPDSKAFSSLEYLFLTTRFVEDELHLNYRFQVKKVKPTPGSFEVAKEHREVDQSIPAAQYLQPSGRINFDRFESAIREAVSTVESKVS